MARLEIVPTICELYDDCQSHEKKRVFNYVMQRPPDDSTPLELAKNHLLALTTREVNELILVIEDMQE